VAAYFLLAAGLAAWFFLRFPLPADPASPAPVPFRFWLAFGGAAIGAIPAVVALTQVYSVVVRLKERSQLLRSADGRPAVDGEPGVFYGPIFREGPSLTAPLSRRDCVLYRYQVTHLESGKSVRRDSPSNPSSQVTDAEGFAMTPSAIQTAAGVVKLRTFVKLEFNADRFLLEEVGTRLDAHLAAATIRGRGSLEDDYQALQAVLKDADGAIRYDRGTGTIDRGVSHMVKEHVVQHGDHVCVFGRYSAAQGAVVPDPSSPALIPTRLRKGSLDVLARRLLLGACGYAAGTIAWAAMAAGCAWAFFRFGPSVW
jgi:hypothetical protein